MSALSATSAAAISQLITVFENDPEASLYACLMEIERLSNSLEVAKETTSWGYSRGATRRSVPPVPRPAIEPQPLDL